MKLCTSVVFYILSIYFVSNVRSFIWKEFKSVKFEIRSHRKNKSSMPSDHEVLVVPKRTVGIIITPPEPDSSTADLLTVPEKTIETIIAPSKPSMAESLIPSDISVITEESSAAHCFPANLGSTNVDLKSVDEAMTKARFSFALAALNVISLTVPKKNLLFSPYDTYETLTLVYIGSRGTLESSLREILRIPRHISKFDIQRFYNNSRKIEQQREKKGDESRNYEYDSATHLWISKRDKLRKCMLDLFGNEVENIDFPDRPKDLITEWISNATKGQKNDLILENAISANTYFLLATSIYFKGLWATPFDEINIRNGTFYGTVNTSATFMDFTGNFHYVKSEKLGVQLLQLPYEGTELSMFILLPSNPNSIGNSDGLDTLLNKLMNNEAASSELKKYLKGVRSVAACQVSLPRFTIDETIEEVYRPDKTNLDDFVDGGKYNDHGGLVVYYAKLDVNENVAKAAATRRLIPDRLEPVFFDANHPFLFIIYDVIFGEFLFAGIYRTALPPSDPSP